MEYSLERKCCYVTFLFRIFSSRKPVNDPVFQFRFTFHPRPSRIRCAASDSRAISTGSLRVINPCDGHATVSASARVSSNARNQRRARKKENWNKDTLSTWNRARFSSSFDYSKRSIFLSGASITKRGGKGFFNNFPFDGIFSFFFKSSLIKGIWNNMYETRSKKRKRKRKLRKENKGTRIWNRNRESVPWNNKSIWGNEWGLNELPRNEYSSGFDRA